MATTKRGFVFSTFLLSCISVAFLITSFATKMWVEADLSTPITAKMSHVNYGLFTGTYDKYILTNTKGTFDIVLTCIIAENICAWSCLQTEEERKGEVWSLLVNGTGSPRCQGKSQTVVRSALLSRATNATSVDRINFVNAGLWISTILFLTLSLVVTAVAMVLAVFNTATNPKNSFLAIEGLYYWNSLAVTLDVCVLALWGTQFAITLTDNVALSDVIQGNFVSRGQASLGYSYWFVLVAMIISAINVALLVTRDYLIRREPPPPVFDNDVNAQDVTIFLY